jgi:quinol monooxygenase YgiN
MKRQPGFLSATIHKSLDGTTVVNYAQWQSRAAFEAIWTNPEVSAHLKPFHQLATHIEPHLYEVCYIETSSSLPDTSSGGASLDCLLH